MSMNFYTNTELADIHFNYGLTNGNEHTTVRLLGETYATRQQPNHLTFTRAHQHLEKHGLSELRLNVLGGRKQHEHPHSNGCVVCCEPKSRYQFTGVYLCNRKISNNCPSCTAGRSLTSVSYTKRERER
ncbi:hypothetical protein TNCV_2331031 [Trichonephila clavipes]|nr:hypothetical protein TNCV_2331031 [Trichonephila clavipes]